jgi:hypothetical protein
MTTSFLRLTGAVAIAAALALAPVAQARDWHGGWHRYDRWHHGGGGGAAAAVIGGLVGLGVGAAIASSRAVPPPAYYGPAPGYAPPPAVYYGY